MANFLTVKIENMNIQHSEREERRAEPSFRRRGVRKPYGVVAVACGEGMCKVFEELGADVVIDEEKYGNPSVETLVKAVEAVNAENVFLLPDNANVLMGAQEAASMCGGCKVTVIPTRDCGSGYVALTALDCGSGDDGEIAAAMDEAVEAASCGAVARAVRDADMNGVSVSAGQYIAVSGKNILLAADQQDGCGGRACAKPARRAARFHCGILRQRRKRRRARRVQGALCRGVPIGGVLRGRRRAVHV